MIVKFLDSIEEGLICVKWNGWNFSGGHTDGDYQEYSLFEGGVLIGYLQLGADTISIIFEDAAKTDDTLSVFNDKSIVERAENVLNKALARDDKEILAACGDEAGNIYLPSGFEDISRKQVLEQMHYTANAIYDTVTIRQNRYDDFDIYFANADCSLRGSANDILNELAQGELEKVRDFASENFCKETGQLTVTHEQSCTSVSSPWMDTSARFLLDDADALFTWGIKTVVDFIIKSREVMSCEQ